jgi:hypothetical protein
MDSCNLDCSESNNFQAGYPLEVTLIAGRDCIPDLKGGGSDEKVHRRNGDSADRCSPSILPASHAVDFV